jgi:hypothetical protein
MLGRAVGARPGAGRIGWSETVSKLHKDLVNRSDRSCVIGQLGPQ